MIFKLIFFFICASRCVYGLPLEAPTDDLKGFFSKRIVGGTLAPDGYAPHLAALVAGEMVTLIACGGSIVHPNLILTGARCIEMFEVPGGLLESFHAVVGATNRVTQGITVEFKGYHIHPEFDPNLYKNDIGFLTLEDRLVMSDTIKVISLNFNWVDADEESYVAGWGRLSSWGMYPFHLKVLNVTTIGPQRCVEDVAAASLWWAGWPHVDPTIEICTYDSVGTGLCHGDAGVPLISRRTQSQIGIGSWAFPCALGVPDMYTRISAYKGYIQEVMNKYK